mmetsp:Transcript_26140/g.22894  ORF Transcript_26140/g.22894 Transcript_26140/m.22894 type:complete len:261 (-) Transcript_26140:90-872(-)|eukprot:CAMPEP_0201568202 /NCGR_PEP_ID=MMETSP0190_2-20130828/9153_1 /ASSEMBLY_ACC=CAM_ASM_000263 /TAXON_ID=37353 /ORGANISM="Rosalina sp." /LENGTH=260 /DNA_ID=CAMNT_0047989065 /DNA_START=25 /DNA_END=807 /DNA_ORIENTATION=+
MSTFVDIPFDKPVKGPEQKVEQSAFFLTGSHSRITQNGKFVGLKKIQVTGKSIIEHNTTMRGDLAKIKIGYYVVIGEGTVLKPAEKFGDQLSFIDMTIGDYTVIGRHCVIRAWQIGCCCWIGEGSVINNKCVVEDCGMVLENTVLAPGTVVPPYTVFAGNPGRCIGRLPPTFDMIMNEHTHAFYAAFKPEKSATSLTSRTGSSRTGPSRSGRSGPRHNSHALTRSTRTTNKPSSSNRPPATAARSSNEKKPAAPAQKAKE